MSNVDHSIQLPRSRPDAEPDRGPPTAASLQVPHGTTGVRRARHAVEEQLSAAGVPAAVRADAVLVLSELVSNSVRHAAPLPGGEIGVRWSVTPEVVHLEITDGGSSTRPLASVAAMTSVGGRGLDIVRGISREWGVTEGEDSVTVWADVPVPGSH